MKLLAPLKKKGDNLQIAEFRNVLEECRLNDLGFIGRWFMWERSHFQSTNIRERLDRGVANLDWINLFPMYLVEHLAHTISNYCLIFLDTIGKMCYGKSKWNLLFRFEVKWCLEQSFEESVRKAWADPNMSVPAKLTKAGHLFKSWSRTTG